MKNINFNLLDLQSMLDKTPLPNSDKEKNTSEDFIDDGIMAANRLNILLKIISSLIPSADISKIFQGILLGHIVRLAKLYDSLLLLACENQSEAAMLIARATVETAIHLKYLRNEINEQLCEKFIKSSLSYDKKLWEFISSKTQNRELEQFEDRILQTIERNFQKTKFKIEDINFKKDSKWHDNLLKVTEKIGLIDVYETMYRLFSRAEHGSWQHLESFHLEDKGDYYSPQLLLTRLDPQILFGTSFISLEGALNYIGFIQVEDKLLLDSLKELLIWFQKYEDSYIRHKNNIYK